jgi:hypothetical protein
MIIKFGEFPRLWGRDVLLLKPSTLMFERTLVGFTGPVV